MTRKSLFITSLISVCGLALTGCATISEESCIAGSWEALGYQDGREGQSRGQFAEIAETCAKYGVTADAALYRAGYDQGLPLYCSYDTGFATGEEGGRVKPECLQINAVDYVDGHTDGYAHFSLLTEYEELIERHDDILRQLKSIDGMFSNEALSDSRRESLLEDRIRLRLQRDEARIDIRAFERVEGWPRRSLETTSY